MPDLMKILKESKLNFPDDVGGTDKATIHSFIQNFYQPYFDKFLSPFKILEIGVRGGGSCVLWKLAFPEAIVWGVDNKIDDFHKLNYSFTSNFEIFESDAYSETFITSVGKNWDLIIDDGPHTLSSQKLALKYIDSLSTNGTLIIEDIQNGILDIQHLIQALPKEVRGKTEYVSFRKLSNRYDDVLFIYSNSREVLEFVKSKRLEIKDWRLISPTLYHVNKIICIMFIFIHNSVRSKKINNWRFVNPVNYYLKRILLKIREILF